MLFSITFAAISLGRSNSPNEHLAEYTPRGSFEILHFKVVGRITHIPSSRINKTGIPFRSLYIDIESIETEIDWDIERDGIDMKEIEEIDRSISIGGQGGRGDTLVYLNCLGKKAENRDSLVELIWEPFLIWTRSLPQIPSWIDIRSSSRLS